MEQSKRNKSNRGWMFFIKLVIALIALWFIYLQVVEKENIRDLFREIAVIFSEGSKLILLVVVFLLMLLNWSVEAMKWKLMISKIEAVNFLKSLRAVFSGLTVSFFTPNRIGEYAGRVFHLETADRIKATLITIVESLSQLLITMVAGSIGLLFYLGHFTGLNHYFFFAVAVFMSLFIFSCFLLFLNVSVLNSLFIKYKVTKSWIKFTVVFDYYKSRELIRIILLAAARYLIFTTQFFLLLILFDVRVSYPMAMVLISLIYFVMTFVPTIALTEIGVRGAVAVFFFSQVTDQPAAVLNATVSLWLINLAIPALVGVVFVFMFHFERKVSG